MTVSGPGDGGDGTNEQVGEGLTKMVRHPSCPDRRGRHHDEAVEGLTDRKQAKTTEKTVSRRFDDSGGVARTPGQRIGSSERLEKGRKPPIGIRCRPGQPLGPPGTFRRRRTRRAKAEKILRASKTAAKKRYSRARPDSDPEERSHQPAWGRSARGQPTCIPAGFAIREPRVPWARDRTRSTRCGPDGRCPRRCRPRSELPAVRQ